jgi:hypothetical protein
MNPLMQLKKATPLFVIMLVLACFALSPQAFAEPPTLSPPGSSDCTNCTWVTISCTTCNAKIHVKYGSVNGNLIGGRVKVCHYPWSPTTTLTAYCYVGDISNPTCKSETVTGTYKRSCSTAAEVVEVVICVTGVILLAAGLIWLFKKRSSASR